MNEHFRREEIQMANKHMKTSSRSLVIREVQIRMRYPQTTSGMAKTFKLMTSNVVRTRSNWNFSNTAGGAVK